MIYNLQQIFSQQIQLDKHIHENRDVTYKQVHKHLKLALIVELCELANEVRSFKFWSIKKPSSNDILLEEYVDGIHFITSLCIYHKMKNYKFLMPANLKSINNKDILTNKFTLLIKKACEINDKKSAKKWYLEYLKFGYLLGFNIDQIIDAYNKKNMINHKRQNENY